MLWKTEFGKEVRLKLCDIDAQKSKRQSRFKTQIKRLFPYHTVYEEVRIPFTRLSIDLLIPSLRVAIEVDSELHEKYNAHFHNHYHKFVSSQSNDKLKDRLCLMNNIKIIRLSKETYTDDELYRLILE